MEPVEHFVEDEPVYRSVAMLLEDEEDAILVPNFDHDPPSCSKKGSGEAWPAFMVQSQESALCGAASWSAPSSSVEHTHALPAQLVQSPAVSRGSSSHTTQSWRQQPEETSWRQEEGTAEEGDEDTEEAAGEDLDDLLRTLAHLRVENAELQAANVEMEEGLQQLDSVNEAIEATLRPAAPAAPRRASYGALSSTRPQVAALSGARPKEQAPELTNSKRPRSFTSELAAEPLHPCKQQSDAHGVPQGSCVSVGQLRELIDSQRRVREQLQQQTRENAALLSSLQQTNIELRRQLKLLQDEWAAVEAESS